MERKVSRTDLKLVALARSDVLGYEVFRADQNFFYIGGNSIMILKVHAFLDKNQPGIVQLPDLFAFRMHSGIGWYISNAAVPDLVLN